ncbi:hypothetical protein GMO_08130 [Gluconobacter morbifer G707]|uniref:DUF1134 domain-containing protein n=2 Tax=Gluconobacter TaxID=441 RepID=G6XH48_9PROT|nr:hypothetical protein GMO_08130 [Gluconobacter morbifer G707]
MAGLGLAATGTASAADTLGTPSGHIILESHSADIGVGLTWGEGKLVYDHQTYRFKISGGNLAAVGYSTVKAEGTVYNLKHLHDFDGSYGSLAGEATLDKGLGGAVLQNSNGVRVRIDTTSSGARLAAGAQGLTFTLKN